MLLRKLLKKLRLNQKLLEGLKLKLTLKEKFTEE